MSKKNLVALRIPSEELDKIKRVAEKYFEGNVSFTIRELVRKGVKDFSLEGEKSNE